MYLKVDSSFDSAVDSRYVHCANDEETKRRLHDERCEVYNGNEFDEMMTIVDICHVYHEGAADATTRVVKAALRQRQAKRVPVWVIHYRAGL